MRFRQPYRNEEFNILDAIGGGGTNGMPSIPTGNWDEPEPVVKPAEENKDDKADPTKIEDKDKDKKPDTKSTPTIEYKKDDDDFKGNNEEDDKDKNNSSDDYFSGYKLLFDNLGIDITKEDFEKEYGGEGADNLSKFVRDVVSGSVESEISKFPEVKQLYDYLSKGNPYEDFFTAKSVAKSYKDVPTDTPTGQNQLNAAILKRNNPNWSDERIAKVLETYSEEERKAEAEKAKDFLVKEEEAKIAKAIQQKEEAEKAATKRAEDFNREILDILEKNDELDGLPISKVDKTKVLEYMYKPTKKLEDGRIVTEMEYNRIKNGPRNTLKYALLEMNGLNKDALEKFAKTFKAQNVKLKIEMNNKKDDGKKATGATPDNKHQDVEGSILDYIIK